ncbi:zinc ribbon domain-containing protein, partial [bacterium]
EIPICPGCSRHIEADWVAGPHCHTRLKKRCQQCGRLMDLAWNLCPYCATPAPGVRRENITMDEALQSLPSDAMAGEPAETVAAVEDDLKVDAESNDIDESPAESTEQ